MPNESIAHKTTPVNQTPPATLEQKIDDLSVEDKLISAVVRFHHARLEATTIGRLCMQMEHAYGRGGSFDQAKYVEAMLQYRQALALMSAARYDLVTLLGW